MIARLRKNHVKSAVLHIKCTTRRHPEATIRSHLGPLRFETSGRPRSDRSANRNSWLRARPLLEETHHVRNREVICSMALTQFRDLRLLTNLYTGLLSDRSCRDQLSTIFVWHVQPWKRPPQALGRLRDPRVHLPASSFCSHCTRRAASSATAFWDSWDASDSPARKHEQLGAALQRRAAEGCGFKRVCEISEICQRLAAEKKCTVSLHKV